MRKREINTKELLESTEAFVRDFYLTRGAHLIYHTLEHTEKVVDAANRIASSCDISDYERTNLLIAAWFHDTGYVNGMNDHEAESVRIMREALTNQGVKEERMQQISEIILSTRIPHNPSNILCRIICDADMVHLSEIAEYPDISENLRKELNQLCCMSINEKQWLKMNIEFMSNHCYFTEYGRKFLAPAKDAILQRIRKKFRRTAG